MQTFVPRTIRPRTPLASASEIQQTPGMGIEVVAGGGNGVELIFQRGDDEEQRAPAVVGDVLPIVFDRFRVEWPDIGAVNADRSLLVRIWRANVIGRVNNTPTVEGLGVGRVLLAQGTGIFAGTGAAVRATLYNAATELPARLNRAVSPGVSGRFMSPEGWLEIVVGAVGDPITTAPRIEVYAYIGSTSTFLPLSQWGTYSMSAIPAGALIASPPVLFTHFLNPVQSNSRIPAPPNGCRIDITSTADNEDVSYAYAIYACG